MVDTRFTQFAFPATGAPTSRTMPARLAAVYDVKDWGAAGDNSHDDTLNIQAAVTAAMAAGGGTIFFPAGTYKTTAAITFNTDADFGIRFTGVGAASAITSSFAGYIFDRSLGSPNNTYGPRTFDNLAIRNNNASGGCIRLGSTIGGGVRDCQLTSPFVCFTSEDSAGVSSQAINFSDVIFSRASGTTAQAIILGGSGTIQACDILSFAVGLRLYGGGIVVDGDRMEQNTIAILLGLDSADADAGLNGASITGMPMEGNVVFIKIAGTTSALHIGPNNMTGHDTGGIGSTTHTTHGIWILADKLYSSEIVGFTTVGQWFDVAAIYVEDYTTRSFVTFSNITPTVGGGTGVPWRISQATAGFAFLNCNITMTNAPYGTRYTFADLPGAGTRLEGDTYAISNSSTTTLGATASAASPGSSATVRFDGTNWLVVPG